MSEQASQPITSGAEAAGSPAPPSPLVRIRWRLTGLPWRETPPMTRADAEETRRRFQAIHPGYAAEIIQ